MSITTLATALEAARELAARGLSTRVADARFAKPLDEDLVRRLAREHQMLITIEEGAIGGFASQVMHALVRQGLVDAGVIFRRLCLPDAFIDHGTPEEQRRCAHLAASDVVALACNALAPALYNGRVMVASAPLALSLLPGIARREIAVASTSWCNGSALVG